ncbi:hypothetical protein K2173_005323 [Erythroxylum novogranatense]|uniref:Acid phosphatase n=1 Tax=Erythroxylum novogranatense TaxID=1862640 RepID=A0AAV8TIP6_9ROSI|nr:hypothetical protein K2173_005323 [Erythroxylum novogranatense]
MANACQSQSMLSLLFLLICFLPTAISRAIIQMPYEHRLHRRDEDLFCESWRLSVETNNVGYWTLVPSKCASYVELYMNGDKYISDSVAVALDSVAFAETINVGSDGKDAWVFDIDETLLSNLPFYKIYGYGTEPTTDAAFNEWAELAAAPVLPASLKFYNDLKQLGFTIILLTGRTQNQTVATVKNLVIAGYSDWERLILRGPDDNEPAIVFKSKKRAELESEGYRIRGSSGDQWSDLFGYAVAERSFKLPNPMYFVP